MHWMKSLSKGGTGSQGLRSCREACALRPTLLPTLLPTLALTLFLEYQIIDFSKQTWRKGPRPRLGRHEHWGSQNLSEMLLSKELLRSWMYWSSVQTSKTSPGLYTASVHSTTQQFFWEQHWGSQNLSEMLLSKELLRGWMYWSSVQTWWGLTG